MCCRAPRGGLMAADPGAMVRKPHVRDVGTVAQSGEKEGGNSPRLSKILFYFRFTQNDVKINPQ